MTRPEQTPSLYGRHTRAAVENFAISGQTMPREVIDALAQVKAAAAVANAARPTETGVSSDLARAIVGAVDELVAGVDDSQFPVDPFQTGSGTSTNTNVNEVLASLASRHLGRDVHPNDHVNASQSTNDVMPTAIRVATLTSTRALLLPSLRRLERELGLKAHQFGSIRKPGRTHLMDATPIMLGDEFDGYRAQVHDGIERLRPDLERLAAVPLGGTATGNGFRAPPGFGRHAIEALGERTGLSLRESPSRFAAQGAQDDIVEFSGHLRGIAVSLLKVANDIRLMASGPTAGLAEITIPELQPGSSLMPGKVNPVICEAVMQVSVQVMGNDLAVSVAASHGNLELNTFLPVIARNVAESIRILGAAADHLAYKCVVGIRADVERCRQLSKTPTALATALAERTGYDTAAKIARASAASGRSVVEVAIAEGLIDESEARAVFDVSAIADGSLRRTRSDLPFEDPHVPFEAVRPGDAGTIGPGSSGS